MTFEFHEPIEATLKSVTPRTEKHGEDDVLALSMGLAITGPNTLLDKAFPGLRQSIYTAVEGQPQLPGVEEATPKLRTKLMELVQLSAKYEGWTLTVDHGIDEDDPIALGGCRIDKFRVRPMEGGSVELLFRIGSNDIDSEEAGQLFGKLHQTISIRLKAPEKPADVIDGTVGHPGLAAQRAEEAGQQRLDGLDEDAERRADDATGAFLGLQGHGAEDGGGDGHEDGDGQPGGDDASGDGAGLAGASPAEQAAAAHEEPRKRRRTAAQQFIDQHSAFECSMADRITGAGIEPLPAFGQILGGRLDGWRYHFIRFEAYADELVLLAKCSAPRWPFPCDIPLEPTLFRKLRAVPGERAKRLATADLIEAAYRGAALPAPAWLSKDKRMTVRACLQREARNRRTTR